MSILPVVPARFLIKFLLSHGFEIIRQKGSHIFFRHPDGRTALVPDHKGEDLGRGILIKILKDCEYTTDEFIEWYRS